ncbi:MAG: diadenylate cyclase [Planctomycetota bacterium]|jgi:DNA integrity scanning protein DisA with diadenylate cyclase activity
MAESTRVEKRCSLLQQELQLEGLWTRLGASNEVFATLLLAELLHALKLPRHERRLPAYGSVIWPEEEVGADEQLAPSTLDEARALVNGTSSFVRRGQDGALTVECFERRIDSELEMVMLSDKCRGTIVQRTPSGVVKVYTSRDVIVYEQGVWYSKPYSSRFARMVMSAAPSADPAIVDSVLRLAVHGLSAANIGATLVLRIDHTLNKELQGVHAGTNVSPLSLSVNRAVHVGPIAHLLARADGAMVLSRDGHVQEYGCHLSYTDRARDALAVSGGTRHTSAKYYSYDEPETLVITVSEDGPVTVFSRGARVVELAARSTDREADLPKEQAPETDD